MDRYTYEQLDRIEQKLDVLLDALLEEHVEQPEEPTDEQIQTLEE